MYRFIHGKGEKEDVYLQNSLSEGSVEINGTASLCNICIKKILNVDWDRESAGFKMLLKQNPHQPQFAQLYQLGLLGIIFQ